MNRNVCRGITPFYHILQWDFWGWFPLLTLCYEPCAGNVYCGIQMFIIKMRTNFTASKFRTKDTSPQMRYQMLSLSSSFTDRFLYNCRHFSWSSLHSNNILYLVIYKFYVFHIQCNRLIIQHLIQQTNNSHFTMSLLHVLASTWPSSRRSLRNTQKADSMKNVRMCSQNTVFSIKIAKCIQNTD